MAKAPLVKTKVVFSNSYPRLKSLRKDSLLIFDNNLLKDSATKAFIGGFQNSYGVKAGESLKSLAQFEKHLRAISTIVPKVDRHRLKIIAMGGGSIGDFVGFLASVYHRGTQFIQIPSTWLAAIDSAHGGKNGLNFEKVKNQIGTIYYPDAVYVSKKLLETQPKSLEIDVQGEFIKHALLTNKSWAKLSNLKSAANSKSLWKNLPAAIDVKYNIIKKDPYETKGIRHGLNLGHTTGHIIESVLGTSHGLSVALGLHFMLNWSKQRGYISKKICSGWSEYIEESCHVDVSRFQTKFKKQVSSSRVKSLLTKDKKTETKNSVKFVFLKGKGIPQVVLVTHQQIINELKRQGWL